MSFGDFLTGLGKVVKAPGEFVRSGGFNGRIFANGEDGLNPYGRFMKKVTDPLPSGDRLIGDAFIKAGEKLNK